MLNNQAAIIATPPWDNFRWNTYAIVVDATTELRDVLNNEPAGGWRCIFLPWLTTGALPERASNGRLLVWEGSVGIDDPQFPEMHGNIRLASADECVAAAEGKFAEHWRMTGQDG
jgi:hypothetical protein